MNADLLAISTAGYLSGATGGYILGIATRGFLTGTYTPPTGGGRANGLQGILLFPGNYI